MFPGKRRFPQENARVALARKKLMFFRAISFYWKRRLVAFNYDDIRTKFYDDQGCEHFGQDRPHRDFRCTVCISTLPQS